MQNHSTLIPDYDYPRCYAHIYKVTENLLKMPLIVTSVAVYYHKKNYFNKQSNFESFTFMYVTEGEVELLYNGKSFILKKHDACFIYCHDTYEIRVGKNGYFGERMVTFVGSLAPILFKLCFEDGYTVVNMSKSTNFLTLHSSFFHLCNTESFETCLKLSDTLYKIIMEFCMLKNADIVYDTKHSSCLDLCLAYIQNNLDNEITLNDLENITYVSKSTINRAFKDAFQMTPYAYINWTRINKAKFLLDHSSASIKQIAYEVGFSDTCNFTHAFKKITGITPGNYRSGVRAEGRTQ